jgi:hypothetical protein
LQPFNQFIIFSLLRRAIFHVIHNVSLRINLSVVCSSLNFLIVCFDKKYSVKAWLSNSDLIIVIFCYKRKWRSDFTPRVLHHLPLRLFKIRFNFKTCESFLKQLSLGQSSWKSNQYKSINLHLANGIQLLF